MSKYLYVSIQIGIYDNHLNVNIEPNEEKLMRQTKKCLVLNFQYRHGLSLANLIKNVCDPLHILTFLNS